MRQFFTSALEVIEVALIALGAVFFIRSFLVQPFLVSGASMVPTFVNDDYLLVDELTYRLRSPARGEVVVFRYPKDESTYFIKRIIGLPGDRIEIKSGNVVVFDAASPAGTALDEEYLPPGTVTVPRSGDASAFTLRASEYLVLGDNRSYSFDSRDWGVLAKHEIIGLVRLRLWPLSGFTVFAAPQYEAR